MSNLLVDQRDQKFVLHDMLEVGQLCRTSHYGHLSEEMIDASLEAALELELTKKKIPIILKSSGVAALGLVASVFIAAFIIKSIPNRKCDRNKLSFFKG